MMGLIMTFVMILVFIACTVGITLSIKNKNILNKPSWGILISLVFQLLLFTLFFTEVLASFPKVIAHLLWWGAVLSGLIFGIRDFKNNLITSVLSILLSVSLAGLMFLMLAITSM
ncbi:putative membrane protein [Anoxybacillus sp. B7M1]|jgi:hypothetical protein|uniref:Uncharacterized protein n=4 Tax=Anoxybacillaceae TaxID=3120669 RepID=A0A023DKE5_9BACL|nr:MULTISPECIES: hypothetical protein [Anoxybacillus]ANB56490.1 putative membrane protein [Anoxybacillus sp. B2M1]ANB64424.1 putative membrane protein [Anoxybacillus sp. B7M1]MBB3854049.1 hypothetical protein [Parageobacillus caldoxylosilyticus]RDE34087.1 hypothetical protein DV713_08200 [Parageobacillus thermoglucosidasius]GAJ41749.1 hypothetical protein GCA01S_094_00120 [Parageobacillus caldoxylosilyticus NBRC 107762]